MSKTKQKNHIVSISNQGRSVQFLLAKERTNIIEETQLEELTKEHALYLPVEEYVYGEEMIQLDYSLIDDFKPLSEVKVIDEKLVKKMIQQLAKMEDMLGTQYTPFIGLENVFINHVGEVKFAFRGLRMVTTKEELTPKDLFLDSKQIIVHILTMNFPTEQRIIAKVKNSKNFTELFDSVNVLKQNNHVEKQANQNIVTEQQVGSNRKNLVIIGCIGLLIGFLSMYVVKVIPLAKEVQAKQQEVEQQVKMANSANTDLQKKEKQIEQEEKKQSALLFVLNDEQEQAIDTLESIGELNDEYNQILLKQYIKLDTIDSLSKALQMKEIGDRDLSVIQKLLNKQDKAADQIVLSYQSEKPAILAEQAYLSKKFDEVITLANKDKENERMSYLAAESFLQKKKPDEALALAKKIKNKQLQLNSLNVKKELVQKNKKLKKEDKEKQVKQIDEEIKKLG